MNKKASIIVFLLAVIGGVFFLSGGKKSPSMKEAEIAFRKAVSMQESVVPGDKRYDEFLSLLKESSDLHYPIAQFRYAEILLKGQGLKKDVPEALRLLNQSKEKEPRSKELLALIYLQEIGKGAVGRDTVKGIGLLTQSAAAGLMTSQYLLGTFYLHGENGLDKSTLQAYYWLRRAAEQGDKVSQLTLARLVGQGFEVPPDDKRSKAWECLANSQKGFDSFDLCKDG
ncbi:tetratricopeptide repeat protein [Gallaecimonas kandeliae]|uniref:tetratricopeptide repeat protein n=1 Tax=Gallaecimonas kandeliae TaxID=3029055 RepID=UPI002647C6F0|nr:tetratricopeptide repeat protein [Gallaecimonas kandeliae]WKE65425.1 tetratricopeptide repeat protein [Gallaecimonas kandeliae]